MSVSGNREQKRRLLTYILEEDIDDEKK